MSDGKIGMDRYIVVQQWMISELGLKGSELLAYALIYGINQNKGRYYGSAEYLAETWLGITPKKGYRVLASMVAKGLLEKSVENGRTYYTSLLPQKGTDLVPKGGSDNIDDNIDNIDIINNNNTIVNSSILEPNSSLLEPDEKPKKSVVRQTSEKLCLFEDSKFADFEDFKKMFVGPEFERIDLYYYHQVIMDWSASKGAKKRDWIATARNWMRSDKEKNKLHLIDTGMSDAFMAHFEQMAELFGN